ncbi:MAG: tripartite tricarboxylate transporter TctB family protein [Rhizobiaceae bacterium]|nr:tripartite tricarboxylate transporter TctB family protein [Rhizobiaceae bacterium]
MTKDLGLGLIALVFSAIYIVEASRIRTSALGDSVGAGGVPMILGWMMAGTAVVLILHQLWLRRTGKLVPAAVSEAFERPGRTFAIAAGVVAMAAVYIASLRWLGYIPATALLLAGMLLYQGVGLSRRLFVVPVAGSLVLWLLFDAVLGLNLPSGLLGAFF